MDTVNCPRCDLGNAYFNGVAFECPDCDYTWDGLHSGRRSSRSSLVQEEPLEYESLIRLPKPFFQLAHGKLFDCAYFGREESRMSIMPLAFEKNRNRQFILLDARRLQQQHPKVVLALAQMSFKEIWNDGTIDFPDDFSALTIVCATCADGSLLDYGEATFLGFEEAAA